MCIKQFIKSVKKIFLWYLYGRFREQIFSQKVDYSRQKYWNSHQNKANMEAYSAIG